MTRYFSMKELLRSRVAQERGISNDLPEGLEHAANVTLAGCERVRAFLGYPMQLLSGYRCHDLNIAVGGVDHPGVANDSQHTKAEAVDFVCPVFGTPEIVFAALKPAMAFLGIDQLILEGTWIHMSFTLNPRNQALRLTEDGRYVPA